MRSFKIFFFKPLFFPKINHVNEHQSAVLLYEVFYIRMNKMTNTQLLSHVCFISYVCLVVTSFLKKKV